MRFLKALTIISLISFAVNAQSKISGTVNIYTPVVSIDKCSRKLTVGSATGFQKGDTILLIQMKGINVDSSNSSSFGSIKSYNNAGNYEFNIVELISGSTIQLKYKIERDYTISGKVQLVRVPYYKSAKVTGTLSAAAWNGTTGGILAFFVKDTLDLAASVDVSGKGFAGGIRHRRFSYGLGFYLLLHEQFKHPCR